MKTPQEWMEANGYDQGVCCGHGEYWDLPKRLTLEMVKAIRADVLMWAADQIVDDGNPVVARGRILNEALKQ